MTPAVKALISLIELILGKIKCDLSDEACRSCTISIHREELEALQVAIQKVRDAS